MAIEWTNDVDQALAQGKQECRTLMLDFNAAPM